MCGTRSVTYADLDRWSDRLAADLAGSTEANGRPIGILLERSVEMVVAALAVLKAGAFFLPLDPTAPMTRNAVILEDAAPPVVVTSRSLASRLPEGLSCCLVEESEDDRDAPAFVPGTLAPDDRAYIIFTSGTTGRPKGVEVSHRNVLRLFSTTLPLFEFTEDDVWTVFHSFAFDFSVWEIWGALLHGGCAVVVPDEVAKDPVSFRQLLDERKVTILSQTPSAFQQLLAEDSRHGGHVPLRLVVFGGEALRFAELEPWTDKYGTAVPALVNMYGITETTVHTSYHHVTTADVARSESVIGRPLPDLDMFLVDQNLRHVRPGETGEIVVVGPGVSLGYRGLPELTAQRFVTLEDYNGDPVRGYRSGDLARMRPDGLLVFCGRADSQVKIRGFRIELDEVETALMRHPVIRQAAASVRESRDGSSMLVAHVVPRADAVPDIGILREFLAELLPHYMIPSVVGVLDELPLTGNGKLDRAALPEVARPSSPPSTTGTGTPRSGNEAVLCELFAEALERDAFGPDDDFFAWGGHSLLAIALQRRVRTAFQDQKYPSLPLSQLYRTPSPAGIAQWLEQSHTEPEPLPTWREGETLPLFRQQSDKLIRHVLDPDDLTDHCAMGWRVEGEVDTDVLARAVSHVHDRHEALRARYRLESEAVVEPADTPAPDVVLLQAATEDAAHTALREAMGRPFDLEQGEIWRVVLVTVGAGRAHLLSVVVHHIASDGWSEPILAADLSAVYEALRVGGRPEGPPAPGLRQMAEVQLAPRDSGVWEEQCTHWKSELAEIPSLDFPYPASGGLSSAPRCQRSSLPEYLMQRVEEQARRHGTTPFTVLLTAYGRALSELTGASDFGVGTPVALRGDIRVESAVSCLIDVLCIRMRFSTEVPEIDDLRRVAGTVRRAFAAQDVPFSEVVQLANPPRGTRPPLFQNMFALQNNAIPDLHLAGARTEFFRPLPFGLPTELVTEVRPEAGGGAELSVSYRPDRVDGAFARALGNAFVAHIEKLTSS